MITVHPNSRVQETDQEYSTGRLGWMDSANCRSVLPDDFHPAQKDTGDAARAKKVCAGCEVTADCLEWAMATPSNDREGIYGGLSPRQRQRLRAQSGEAA